MRTASELLLQRARPAGLPPEQRVDKRTFSDAGVPGEDTRPAGKFLPEIVEAAGFDRRNEEDRISDLAVQIANIERFIEFFFGRAIDLIDRDGNLEAAIQTRHDIAIDNAGTKFRLAHARHDHQEIDIGNDDLLERTFSSRGTARKFGAALEHVFDQVSLRLFTNKHMIPHGHQGRARVRSTRPFIGLSTDLPGIFETEYKEHPFGTHHAGGYIRFSRRRSNVAGFPQLTLFCELAALAVPILMGATDLFARNFIFEFRHITPEKFLFQQPKVAPHHSLRIFPSMARRFWITMSVCAVLYLPSLWWALGLDQNIFAEIGSLLLAGKKLYVDAWDVKPPNIFYVYAFFERLFGEHAFAVRASDYVASLLACAAVYATTARQAPHILRRGHEWLAPLAAILLILTLLSLGLADTAQTESYSLFFIIGASLLVQSPRLTGRKRTHSSLFFAAGVFLAIVTFFKTSNAIFLFAVALELWLYNRRAWPRAMLYLALGFMAWSGLQFGMLALQGSLVEYLKIASDVVTRHPHEVSQLELADLPRALWTYLDLWSVLSFAAIILSLIRRDKSFLRAALSPLILFLAGMIAVLIQRKGWGYQYVVILPGLSRLCAISAGYVFAIVRKQSQRVAVAVTAFLVLLTLVFTPSARRRIHYTMDAMQSVGDHSAYLARLGSKQSLYYPLCTDSLANYVALHTASSDPIFIFGDEPGVYWRTHRMPATRYLYSLLFTSGVISNDGLRTMQDTIARRRPALIAIERYDTTAFRGRPETSESLVETDPVFRPLKEFISNQYLLSDTVCDKFLIFKQR